MALEDVVAHFLHLRSDGADHFGYYAGDSLVSVIESCSQISCIRYLATSQ